MQDQIEALRTEFLTDIRGLQSVVRQHYATDGPIHESETSSESMAYYRGSHAEQADPSSKLGIPLNPSSSSTSSTVTEVE